MVLLLSIPAIQTRLGRYATETLNEDFGTNINIERVGLQFNGDVELLDVYVEDHHKDTLFHIEELNTSILSFKKLYDNKFTFGDIDIYGLTFNLKTYKDEIDTNLDVFVAKFDDDKPSTEPSGFLLSSSDMSIVDSNMRLSDENRDPNQVFFFKELNINATDFVIVGPDVSARINKLSLVDERGVGVKNMSTNFSYTKQQMLFEFLQIKTDNSTLNGKLQFDYDGSLRDFTDKVKVTANFENSTLALSDLNSFYNEFGNNQVAKLNTTIFGTLNDLTLSQLELTASRNTIIDGKVNFVNLFDSTRPFKMDGNFNKLSSTYSDLRSIMPKVLGNALPEDVSKLGNFRINGDVSLTNDNLITDVDLNTDLGLIIADLELTEFNSNATVYKGNIVFDEFNLGEYVNDSKLGAVSFNLDVDGEGFSLGNLNTLVVGDVYGLHYNNYYYSDIAVEGNIQNKIFNGKLETKDENVDLTFDGLVDFSKSENNYDFTANVKKADLNVLNFITRDSISQFSGIVTMKMKGTNLDDAYGNISFKNTLYKNQDSDYYFDDFAITSRFEDDIRYISINSPDIIEGSLKGKFKFNEVQRMLENSLGNIYTNYKAHDISEGQFIDFNFKIYSRIAEVFYSDLKLASNTFIKGRVESDAKKFNMLFKSPQIKLKEQFANSIQLRLDNKNPLFNTFVEIDSLNTDYYDVSDFSLINVTLNDTLYIKTNFRGGKGNSDKFDLNLFYTINEENKSVLGFKRSKINFKDNDWYVNSNRNTFNKIEFNRDFSDININKIRMNHLDEIMELSGVIREDNYKDINLDFSNVDLVKITPEIDSLSLGGSVNGNLKILQDKNVYLPQSSITIDDFTVNKFNLGSFDADIRGNESLTNYNLDVSLKNDTTESLSVVGNIDVSGNNSNINVDINFDDFILNPLNPFGEGNITNIRGKVDGYAKVSGRLQRPQIYGQLELNEGGLSIPYLNVDYQMADNTIIGLERQSFIFNNSILQDLEHNTTANLSGSVSHVNLSNWSLDLNLDSNRLLVLNTNDSEDALYYGTAFVNGNIGINGPTDQLVIKAEVTSEEGTIFKIPLNDTETFDENSFIYFLTPEDKMAISQGEEVVLEDVTGLEMDFDLSIDENAEIEIVIDKDSGSTIKGRGNGQMLAQINTNGKFNMYGDFIVSEGEYNFIYGGLVQKEFQVQPGGTLVWEGDPLQAEINLIAIHEGISANPSVLLDNPINQSIPVEVEIHLTGQLEKPDPTFDIRFPSVNSTLNTELQDRLRDSDKKQFQALSLLATGSFRGEHNYGYQDAIGLVSDRVQSMLNDILSSDDGKFDIGLDVELGENRPDYETDSRVGVTLSTKLSDRILINGKVGVPIGGVSESTVAGDFEVEVLLNEDRTLSLKFFNRENSIRYFGEQIGYTQGVGLSYNVEFDNLKELLQKLFSKKNKEKNEKTEDENKSDSDLPDYLYFKEKDSLNIKENQKK